MTFRTPLSWAALALVLGSAAAGAAINPTDRGYFGPEPVKGDNVPYGGPIAPDTTGGPDAFGYVFTDSTEPGGPVYNFIDISTTGTSVALGDDSATTVPIGFTFSFYGADHTSVDAASNGYLTFGTDGTDFSNDCPLLADGTTPPISIFPFWDDLDPGDDGALLYHQQFGSCPVGAAVPCVIVQWEEFDFFPGNGTPGGTAGTFQAVLYQTGAMLFQYQGGPGIAGSGATVGIWNSTLPESLLYQCNAGALSAGLAVLFETPPSGDLAITKSGQVAIGGPYAYTIEVTNNGPENQTGVSVTDVLPGAIVYVSDSCGGDFSDGVWDIGALANGATASCDLVVSLVDPSTCTDVINTATVTGDLFDPASNSTSTNSNAGGNQVQDSSFEDGSPNGFWAEASTNFGSPLCTVGSCGTGTGTGPHTGDWWAWFGGIAAFEAGSVSQSVTIPAGATNITFWVEQFVCSGSSSDYVELNVDGNQLWVTTATDPACGTLGYRQVSVDVSAYADGGAHTVEFNSEVFGSATTNFFLDDVELQAATTCPGVPVSPEVLIQEIPTLGAAGLAALGAALALAAMLIVRRRRVA